MDAWEKEYSRKGRLWRGTTNFKLELPGKSRVLELGCGDGKNLSAISTQGFEVHAIDTSMKAIELCKEYLKHFGGKADFHLMDARNLKFTANHFDAVFNFHCLGHLLEEERKKAASEALRVLKEKGKLFFKEFGSRDFRTSKGREVEEMTFERKTGIITHYFTVHEVKELFPECNFIELKEDSWSVYYSGKKYLREEILAVIEKT